MTAEPLVSVVMSVYDGKNDDICQAIDSILDQTYKNIEFIIFDDNCRGDIKELLKGYSSHDSRIRLIKNIDNKGLTYNLIQGVNIARGEYIARQDADDISFSNRLREQVKFLDTHPEISMACTAYYLLKDGKMKKRSIGFKDPKAIDARLFIENSHILHSSVMMRSSFLKNNELNYNPEIKKSQDYELWTRISEFGKISIIGKYLCAYRISDDQISTREETASEQKEYYKKIILQQLYKNMEYISEDDIRYHLALALGTPSEKLLDIVHWTFRLIKGKKLHNRYNTIYINIVILRRLVVYIAKRVRSYF